uniref:Clc-like protein n=1 Tax=Parastrongyloides trichosuri TaxID=131310 RepID=A0A0N4Z5R9_PARTI
MASTVSQKVLLVLSIVFIVLGLALTLGGAFSPAWQIVDIREFRAEHQHGLWWDCVRAEKHVVAVGDFYDETPLHCMQKFDRSAELVIENTLNNIDEDGAAGESEHHRFWAWHKIVLFFILFGALAAFVSICTGVCAPCFPPCAFVFSISLFVAMICSMIADGVFFLAANRVDNRFVQGMVGTYEQSIGYAFYIHLFGTLAWILAFICTLATTYKFYSSNSRNENGYYPNESRFITNNPPVQRSILANDYKPQNYNNHVQYSQPVHSYQQGYGFQSHHFRETSA